MTILFSRFGSQRCWFFFARTLFSLIIIIILSVFRNLSTYFEELCVFHTKNKFLYKLLITEKWELILKYYRISYESPFESKFRIPYFQFFFNIVADNSKIWTMLFPNDRRVQNCHNFIRNSYLIKEETMQD